MPNTPPPLNDPTEVKPPGLFFAAVRFHDSRCSYAFDWLLFLFFFPPHFLIFSDRMTTLLPPQCSSKWFLFSHFAKLVLSIEGSTNLKSKRRLLDVYLIFFNISYFNAYFIKFIYQGLHKFKKKASHFSNSHILMLFFTKFSVFLISANALYWAVFKRVKDCWWFSVVFYERGIIVLKYSKCPS